MSPAPRTTAALKIICLKIISIIIIIKIMINHEREKTAALIIDLKKENKKSFLADNLDKSNII